jgi:hypothetical protein
LFCCPQNDAFDKLPAGTVGELKLAENRDMLTSILTYHVIAGTFLSTDLADGPVETLNGAEVDIGVWTVTPTSDPIVSVDESNVIDADNVVSNGVVHVIDEVLIPSTSGPEADSTTTSATTTSPTTSPTKSPTEETVQFYDPADYPDTWMVTPNGCVEGSQPDWLWKQDPVEQMYARVPQCMYDEHCATGCCVRYHSGFKVCQNPETMNTQMKAWCSGSCVASANKAMTP